MLARSWVPFLSLLLALTVLGALIFHRTQVSELPPFYDALSYVVKAKNFWSAVEQGPWVNPLDLDPTVRPPGSILLSHPLGFSERPQGFYFRSVYGPLLIFGLSLWFIGRPRCTDQRSQWLLVALCLAVCSLPLFYHFEPNRELFSPTRFGLIDTFLAAMAGLATCFVVRGAQRVSLIMTLCGIGVASFCLILKPAGLLIMAVIGVVWLLHVWGAVLDRGPHGERRTFRFYWWLSTASFVFVYGAVIGVCFTSQYFSSENMAFGKRAAEILRTAAPNMGWWTHFFKQIHTSFGWQLFVPCLFLVLFGRGGRVKEDNTFTTQNERWPVFLSALISFSVGLWFWLGYTGGNQIRYFYPFALISLTVLFPQALRTVTVMKRFSAQVFVCWLPVPFLIIMGLLLSSRPAVRFERLLGVNVTAGSLAAEIRQAQSLIDKARIQGRDLTLYRGTLGPFTGMFCGAGAYQKILHPEKPSFVCRTPRDWNRESVLRLSEISPSDYIIFEPRGDDEPAGFNPDIRGGNDFNGELALLCLWLSEAGQEHGVRLVSETSLRLVEIVDKGRFADALEKFKGAHQWRDIFHEENPPKGGQR